MRRFAVMAGALAACSIVAPAAWADCNPQSGIPRSGTHLVYAIHARGGTTTDPAFAQTVVGEAQGGAQLHHWMEIDEGGQPLYEEPSLTITTVAGLIPLVEETAAGARRYRYAVNAAQAVVAMRPGDSERFDMVQTMPAPASNRTHSIDGEFEIVFEGCDSDELTPDGRMTARFVTRYDRLAPDGGRRATENRIWIDPDNMWLVRHETLGGVAYTRLSRVEAP